MQQQRGPRPFDITTRLLIDSDPAGWLRWAGFQVSGPVRPMDSEVSTVLAEVDKVLRVDDREPWLAHFELQSSYDRTLPIRLLQYYGLLLRRHELPIESTVVLLRPQADGPVLDSHFRQHGPRGNVLVTFAYNVIRVWERPVSDFLDGSLGLLPLAPLARVLPAELPDIIAHIDSRLERDAARDLRGDLWASIRILMGLRYDREQVNHLLRRVREMRESVTYQEILEEGRVEGMRRGLAAGRLEGQLEGRLEGRREGQLEGRLEGERRILLRFGTARFGEPDPAVRAQIEALSDIADVERLVDRLLSAVSWEDLLDQPT